MSKQKKNSKKRERLKKNPGDIVEIQVGENEYCYGRALDLAVFAFYDVFSEGKVRSLDDIVRLPVIFKVPVMDYAISSGAWTVIGNKPLDDDLKKPVLFFNQDPISKKIFLYNDSTGEYIPATKKDCVGLECSAVWDPEHVEDRLRDHFAGVPNKWVEDLAIK